MKPAGPLAGVKVIEVGGIGPGPFAGMMLADLGASVTRIDRLDQDPVVAAAHAVLFRGRNNLGLDLKDPGAADQVLDLIADADILIEGFRPGVAERLGFGPDAAFARRPALVYGRMTGWGQDGPLARFAGHDITYLALSGALQPIAGNDGAPVPPLTMLGDLGGGGMLLVAGVLAALHHATATGEGQVVDAAIVDGSALLTSMHVALVAAGMWKGERGDNIFDGGAPYYRVYGTADGKWMAVGSVEPEFQRNLLKILGRTEDPLAGDLGDPRRWPRAIAKLTEIFAGRSRDEWTATFDGVDACVAPVLSPAEAAAHPHLAARGTYYPGTTADAPIPAPAPRFSVTPTRPKRQ